MNLPTMFLISAMAGFAIGCFGYFLLNVLSRIQLEKNDGETAAKLPLLFRLAQMFLPPVRPLAKNEIFAGARKMIEPKLWMAGFGESITAVDFWGVRLLFGMLAVVTIFFGVLAKQPIICLILGALLLIYPSAWLNATIKKRHLEIMKALPNVLDLLTLSVESGRDLMSALRDILSRRRVDALGEELMRTFQEIQLGRKRAEALRALTQRVRQPDLTSTINAIIQAEELGVSIGQQLRIQGDMQRNKRFTLAEKMANEASVKIIIPIVVFILPAVFIILIGPLLLYATRALI